MPPLQARPFILKFEATIVSRTRASTSSTLATLGTKLVALKLPSVVSPGLKTQEAGSMVIVFREQLLTLTRLSRQTEQPVLRGTPTMMGHQFSRST